MPNHPWETTLWPTRFAISTLAVCRNRRRAVCGRGGCDARRTAASRVGLRCGWPTRRWSPGSVWPTRRSAGQRADADGRRGLRRARVRRTGAGAVDGGQRLLPPHAGRTRNSRPTRRRRPMPTRSSRSPRCGRATASRSIATASPTPATASTSRGRSDPTRPCCSACGTWAAWGPSGSSAARSKKRGSTIGPWTPQTIAALRPNQPSDPPPLAQWTFEDGTATRRQGRVSSGTTGGRRTHRRRAAVAQRHRCLRGVRSAPPREPDHVLRAAAARDGHHVGHVAVSPRGDLLPVLFGPGRRPVGQHLDGHFGGRRALAGTRP